MQFKFLRPFPRAPRLFSLVIISTTAPCICRCRIMGANGLLYHVPQCAIGFMSGYYGGYRIRWNSGMFIEPRHMFLVLQGPVSDSWAQMQPFDRSIVLRHTIVNFFSYIPRKSKYAAFLTYISTLHYPARYASGTSCIECGCDFNQFLIYYHGHFYSDIVDHNH